MSSRGDITVGGLEMKEWQRTPVQLLQEYTQRQKRPKPRYDTVRASEKGKRRMRVVLQDPKKPGTDKDLLFTPVESFDSNADAKHCAALLALSALQRDLPLEMKLPEPYKTLWKAMTSKGPSKASKPKPKPATGPPAPAKPAAAAEDEEEGGGLDLWGGAPPPAAAAPAPAPRKRTTINPDAEGRTLSAAHKFASKAEADAHRREKEAKRRARTQRQEAAKHADAQPVMMSGANRESIEAILKAWAASRRQRASAKGGGDQAAEDEAAGQLLAAARDDITAALVRLGFRTVDVGPALDATLTSAAVQHSGYVPAGGKAGAVALQPLVTEALDWLCLHLSEESLPPAFSPVGKELRVVSAGAVSAQASRDSVCQATLRRGGVSAVDAGAVSAAAEHCLPVAEGWLQAACSAALAESAGVDVQDAVPVVTREGEVFLDLEDDVGAMTAIYGEEACQVRETAFPSDTLRGMASPWKDCPATCLAWSAWSGAASDVSLTTVSVSLEHLVLHMTLDKTSYPNTVPIFRLEPAKGSSMRLSHQTLRVATALLTLLAAHTWLPMGASILYDAAAWVQEHTTWLVQVDSAPSEAPPLALATSAVANTLCRTSTLWTAVGPPLAYGRLLAMPEVPVPPTAAGTGAGVSPTPDSDKPRGQGRRRGLSRRWVAQRSEELQRMQEAQDAVSSTPLRDVKGTQTRAWRVLQDVRRKLPIGDHRDALVRLSREHRVFLLCGQTGSGKTTQFPQFVLEDAFARGEGGATHVVVTQPRRIAATGVATRVAQERGEALGPSRRRGGGGGTQPLDGGKGLTVARNAVGYHIRGDANTNQETHLTFCTVGILLRQLQSGLPEHISHICVDEVHERGVDTDFLLTVLKRLLRKHAHLKVVLMSATIDAEKFANYFAPASPDGTCPVYNVPGFVHPVRELYLDDMLPDQRVLSSIRSSDLDATAPKPTVANAAWRKARHTAHSTVAACIRSIAQADASASPAAWGKKGDTGTILVFLPGVPDIRKVDNDLRGSGGSGNLHVVPLHGSLSQRDQSAVFVAAPKGKRKVVLATNIAETSITIDDCTVVIDACRVKEMQYDAATHMARLAEVWTSQASCNQRRGRAGRVMPGRCLRLLPRTMFASLAPFTTPEIQRVPLHNLCLSVMTLGIGEVRHVLGKVMDPPARASVDTALTQLAHIGAVRPRAHSVKGKAGKVLAFELTPLGRHLASMPLDVRLAKVCVYGAVLRCIDPMLTVAACLSGRSPFRNPSTDPDRRAALATAQKALAWGHSDHLTMVQAYNKWRSAQGAAARRKVAETYCLSFEALNTIQDVRRDLAAALAEVGFLPGRAGRAEREEAAESAAAAAEAMHRSVRVLGEVLEDGWGHYGECSPAANACASDATILRSALCAGLYPHVAKVVTPGDKFDETAFGATKAKFSAKELRFYTLAGSSDATPGAADADARAGPEGKGLSMWRGIPQQRVFIHPASVCFSEGNFPSPWLVYHEKVATSKVFVRDVTVASPYALLLFGGFDAVAAGAMAAVSGKAGSKGAEGDAVRVAHADGLVYVGRYEWMKFKAPARLGVLVRGLRSALDELLEWKVASPEVDISASPVVDAVLRLLAGHGY